MSDDLLFSLRDVAHAPVQAGDAGDARVRRALAEEMSGSAAPRRRRSLRLPFGRSISLVPAVLLVGVATAAAAAGTVALVDAGPTTLFERNPQGNPAWGQRVIPSTVRKVATVTVPGVGPLQYWAARATEHGQCWGFRRADGTWLTLGAASVQTSSGSVPGCGPTRESQVVAMGAHPVLLPMSLDLMSNAVEGPHGVWHDIYFGAVTADRATAVKDMVTGATAPVLSGNYFVLVERQHGNCVGCGDIRAVNAAGTPVPADYGPVAERNH